MKAKKEEKDNKKHVRKKKKSKNVLVITAVYVICFSIAAGFFAYTRINKYASIGSRSLITMNKEIEMNRIIEDGTQI